MKKMNKKSLHKALSSWAVNWKKVTYIAKSAFKDNETVIYLTNDCHKPYIVVDTPIYTVKEALEKAIKDDKNKCA